MVLVDKSYCTQTDVERAIGFKADETNVTQQNILDAIKEASDEVDLITHTFFHSAEDSGTATGGSTTTLADTNQTWDVDTYTSYVLWIYSGTGSGQYARIASNTANILTLESDDELTTAPVAASLYRVIPAVILAESLDGSGQDRIYLPRYPIKSLLSLSIVGTDVTPSKVYVYEKTGKLKLHSQLNPEKSYFELTYPQSVVVKWVVGVWPIPRNIIRLTAAIAGLKCLIQQIGGTYDDLTSYTIPHFTASKGEPYTQIRETLVRLRDEIKSLITRVIKYQVVV